MTPDVLSPGETAMLRQLFYAALCTMRASSDVNCMGRLIDLPLGPTAGFAKSRELPKPGAVLVGAPGEVDRTHRVEDLL
jgi:hypothetical protein